MANPWLVSLWLSLAPASEPVDGTAASFPSDATPVWIRTHVMSGESVAQIASRYGASEQDVRQWNALGNRTPAKGMVLRVRVSGDTPALQPVYVQAGKGDTWDSVAARYGVTREAVLAANPQKAKRERPPRDARLTVWIPSGVQRMPDAAPPIALPDFDVPKGGVAVGSPHRGRLENGVQLPDSDLYTKRFDRLCFGTSLAVETIQRAVATFRHETGFDRALLIGAMSRKGGRKLRPHRSHRTGRDVDIRMPALPHAEGSELTRDEIDWAATWAMIDAFVRTDQVQQIYLERKLWERLRRAAMRTGASDERIASAFDVISHEKGHTSHVHVRFVCGPDAPECEP